MSNMSIKSVATVEKRPLTPSEQQALLKTLALRRLSIWPPSGLWVMIQLINCAVGILVSATLSIFATWQIGLSVGGIVMLAVFFASSIIGTIIKIRAAARAHKKQLAEKTGCNVYRCMAKDAMCFNVTEKNKAWVFFGGDDSAILLHKIAFPSKQVFPCTEFEIAITDGWKPTLLSLTCSGVAIPRKVASKEQTALLNLPEQNVFLFRSEVDTVVSDLQAAITRENVAPKLDFLAENINIQINKIFGQTPAANDNDVVLEFSEMPSFEDQTIMRLKISGGETIINVAKIDSALDTSQFHDTETKDEILARSILERKTICVPTDELPEILRDKEMLEKFLNAAITCKTQTLDGTLYWHRAQIAKSNRQEITWANPDPQCHLPQHALIRAYHFCMKLANKKPASSAT